MLFLGSWSNRPILVIGLSLLVKVMAIGSWGPSARLKTQILEPEPMRRPGSHRVTRIPNAIRMHRAMQVHPRHTVLSVSTPLTEPDRICPRRIRREEPDRNPWRNRDFRGNADSGAVRCVDLMEQQSASASNPFLRISLIAARNRDSNLR